MGTRGFIGFVIDNTEKIAYNHFDSYPEGLGVDTLHWLHEATKDLAGLRLSVGALRVVDPQSEPTNADIERLREFANERVGGPSERLTWYQLLRETQGHPREMLRAGVIEDASHFPTDSLFAEWGYVVDLDAGVFEVYRGFQQSAHNAGRFAGRTGPDDSRGYGPCALVKSWPLSALPTGDEFLATLHEEVHS